MLGHAHLLLAITADAGASALVEHGHRLSRSLGGSWSVVAIDTPADEAGASPLRAALLQALDRAQQLGATVTRISTGSNTQSAVVSSLVHRAQSECATDLLLGQRSRSAGQWSQAHRGLSDFTEALSELLPGVTVHLVCHQQAQPQGQRAPSGRRWSWPSLRLAPGVVAVLGACTVAGALLERYVHPANIVMLYLTGVVYVASKSGRGPAIAAVLGSILLYDLIFVPPRWSLKPTEPQHWLAFLIMMVVGLIIGQLAARMREHAILAEARAQRTQALNQLSSTLARARDRETVAQSLCSAVHAAVGSPAQLLELSASGQDLQDQRCVLRGFDPGWARRALASRSELGGGTAHGGDQPLRYLPLIVGEQAFGLLVLETPAAERDSLEDQHLVRALANQAAIALERAELERRSMAKAVEAEGERTRNTLLAGISHDFRTPLTTIMGSATMLLEQAHAIDEPRRTALLHNLLEEAQRLHVLSSNMLDLTRLDEGAIALRPEWCPAEELLEVALRQVGPRLQGRQLVVQAPAEALVWCDARLIDQVLVNLLDNAIRHTPAHTRIQLAIEQDEQHWRLIVHDAGPGIPAGHEEAIFRKFYRATPSSDSMGTGLGLAICAAIAHLHGGVIAVENRNGARFTMQLPQPALPRMESGELA